LYKILYKYRYLLTIHMAYKILQEFLSIYYGKIKGFVLFSVNTRQKSEAELKLSES